MAVNRYIPALILLLIIVGRGSFSQNKTKTDSLVTELKKTGTDTGKVNILIKLFWEYRRTNTEKASEMADQALEIAKSADYQKGIAESLYCLGITSDWQGKSEESLKFTTEALEEFRKLRDTAKIIVCLIEKADIFIKRSDYEKGLRFLNEAIEFSNKTGDKKNLSRIYHKLGGIYNTQKQYDKALEYHYKSLKVNKESGFKLGMSVNYNNIGNVFRDMKQYNSATENYLKALEIKKEIGDIYGIASCLNNLGLIFSDQKIYNKALEYHFNALQQFTKLQDQSKIALCNVNIAYDYLEKGDKDKAIEFSNICLKKADSLNLKIIQTEAYRILSEAYAGLGKYKKALYYQKLYKTYNDSVINVETVGKIANLETRYEIAKREKEISLLNADKIKNELKVKQQRIQLFLMTGLIMLILILLGFLYLAYRNKQKLNKKLEELNLIKSRFFANISHEFRTPLTLLLGPLEKLLNNPKQNEKHLLKIMYRNAARLLFLDNQLLDLSRLEAGKLHLNVSEGDITNSVRCMAMSFRSLAEKKKIDFNCRIPDTAIKAWFDTDKLEKIIYNLLSNSFKFTPENGVVILELSVLSGKQKKELPVKLRRVPGKVVCITVSDTGRGIKKEQLPFIFDRFYQADNVAMLTDKGTGLGLSLTKELTELHHGKIFVESEQGEGTSFKICLPIEKGTYKYNEISSLPEAQSEIAIWENDIQATDEKTGDFPGSSDKIKVSDENSVRLLIVEDDFDMRLYIRDCFDEQYDIFEAENGKQGFETAVAEIPDIIISDLIMPVTDGIELCRKIKTDERTSHIPVILLSALSSVEDRIKGLETGADDYIAKPFNREELVTRVKNLTEQRSLLRERFGKEIKIQPKDITVTSADKKFLEKLIALIEKNISDPDLTVDSVVAQINLSRSQLHRKLKALTGLSATEFIRNIRLKRAAQLLEQHHGTIAETVYAVGFNSLSYFSKCFQKQFGASPKEYIESMK